MFVLRFDHPDWVALQTRQAGLEGTGEVRLRDLVKEALRMQEGGIRVIAPVAHLAATDVVRASGVEESVLGWTHSCHRSNVPCAACPGCWKREQVLYETDMLGHHIPGTAGTAGAAGAAGQA